jgi:hypothetical protein
MAVAAAMVEAVVVEMVEAAVAEEEMVADAVEYARVSDGVNEGQIYVIQIFGGFRHISQRKSQSS